MIDSDGPTARLYLFMAAIAGSVSSLSMRKYRDMSAVDIVLSLFVGGAFAIFVTPLILGPTVGVGAVTTEKVAGITYVMACGWNILMPFAIAKIRSMFGGAGDEK